jgi:hypothetical protein
MISVHDPLDPVSAVAWLLPDDVPITSTAVGIPLGLVPEKKNTRGKCENDVRAD